MATDQFNNQRFRITFTLLFIIIGFYFFYFFILVNQKQETLRQKGYRVLTQINKNIHDKYQNYEGALPNINNQKKLIQQYVKSDPQLTRLTDYNLSAKEADLIRLKQEKNPGKAASELLEEYFFQLQNLKINKINGNSIDESTIVEIGNGNFYIEIDDFMESIKYEEFFADIILSDTSQVVYSYSYDNSFYSNTPLDSLMKKKINQTVLAGKEFKIITLPVEIGRKNYLLSGLIDNQAYAGLTNQFSPFAVASVAVVLFVFLLSIPLVKLQLLSRYERLSRGDVYLAGLSAIIVTSFVVLLLASIFNSVVLERQQIKKNLSYLSHDINSKLQNEINQINPLFSEIENAPFSLQYKRQDFERANYSIWNELVTINSKGYIDNYTTSFYPYFGQPDILRQSIQNIDLNSRAYFNKINGAEENIHYLEPIYSYTTGSVEVANSRKYGDQVQLITSPMYSLLDVVMPKNYSYFIIDNSGKVLFHQREKKILRENFLAETNKNESLRKAVNDRGIQCLRLKYNDKPTLCYVSPLQRAGYLPEYNLIVTYNLQYLQAKSIFTFITAGSLMLIFFLLLLVTSGLLKLNKRKPVFLTYKVFSFHFLLPSNRHFHSYNLLILLHSLLALHLLVILSGIRDYTLYETGINLLMVAMQSSFFIYYFLNSVDFREGIFYNGKFYAEIVLLILILSILFNFSAGNLSAIYHTIILLTGLVYGQFFHKKNSRANVENKKIHSRFFGFAYSWLVIIAVLPAIILYVNVNNNVTYQEIKESAFYYHQQINQQVENINKKYQHNDEQLENKLRNKMIYFHNNKWNEESQKKCFRETINAGDTLKPLIYQALHDKLNIRPYINQLSFYKKDSPQINQMYNSEINEKLKILNMPIGLAFLIITGILFLIILRGGIISFVRKVKPFYSDYKSTFDAADFASIQKLIIYGLSGTNKDKIVAQLVENYAQPKHINFAKLNYDELEEELKKLKKQNHQVIVLENFDHNHQYEKLNQMRLTYLESLVAVPGKVIITTSIGLQKILDDFFSKWLISNNPAEKNTVRNTMDQLESLLQNFTIKTLSLPYIPQPGEPLQQELNYGNYLSSLQQKLVHKMQKLYGVSHFNQLNRQQKEEIIIEIQDISHAYYHSLWNQCTRIEKYVLYDAAEDGFVNHKNKLTIINLLKKGLLVFDDGLKIMNKSFQHFILTGISGTEVIQMEEEAKKRGRWNRYSLIIAVTVISLIVFYILAEQEVVNKFTAIITGLVALVPSLFSAVRSAISGSLNRSAG